MGGYIRKPDHRAICLICNHGFLTNIPNQVLCSQACRLTHEKNLNGREGAYGELPTGTVGAISEIEIAAHFMKAGYAVFRSMSPSCFCDLIVAKKRKIYRIECRTGYRSHSGNVSFPNTAHGTIDYFAVYIPRENKVFIFNIHGRQIDRLRD